MGWWVIWDCNVSVNGFTWQWPLGLKVGNVKYIEALDSHMQWYLITQHQKNYMYENFQSFMHVEPGAATSDSTIPEEPCAGT